MTSSRKEERPSFSRIRSFSEGDEDYFLPGKFSVLLLY